MERWHIIVEPTSGTTPLSSVRAGSTSGWIQPSALATAGIAANRVLGLIAVGSIPWWRSSPGVRSSRRARRPR